MTERTAYQRGLDAAYRTGEYEGITSPPDDSPYQKASMEDQEWWASFGDGTEDLINDRWGPL